MPCGVIISVKHHLLKRDAHVTISVFIYYFTFAYRLKGKGAKCDFSLVTGSEEAEKNRNQNKRDLQRINLMISRDFKASLVNFEAMTFCLFDMCGMRNIWICCLPDQQAEAVTLLGSTMRETRIYITAGVQPRCYRTEL